jgi:hypothetical protein
VLEEGAEEGEPGAGPEGTFSDSLYVTWANV